MLWKFIGKFRKVKLFKGLEKYKRIIKDILGNQKNNKIIQLIKLIEMIRKFYRR